MVCQQTYFYVQSVRLDRVIPDVRSRHARVQRSPPPVEKSLLSVVDDVAVRVVDDSVFWPSSRIQLRENLQV